jgi:hypothetical protein
LSRVDGGNMKKANAPFTLLSFILWVKKIHSL